jgi:hypothetical protein
MRAQHTIAAVGLLLMVLTSLQCAPASVGTASSGDRPPANADQVIDRYIEAIGGAQELSKMTSAVASGTFEAPESKINGTLTIYFKSPSMGALVMKTSDGNISISRVFNGARGLSRTINRDTGRVVTREMSRTELERFKITSDFISSALRYKDLYKTRSLRGKEKLEDGEVYVVEAVDPFGEREVMYFDAKSGFLVRDDHVEDIPDRSKQRAQSYIENWEQIPGTRVKSAFTISTFYPDAADLNSIVHFSDCKVNVPLDDSLFALPRN